MRIEPVVMLAAVLVACPSADEQRLCIAELKVRVPEPNPLTDGAVADVARVVISRAGAELFNESVQLFAIESGGIRVQVVDPSGKPPVIAPSAELQLDVSVYSSFDRGTIPVLATGRTGVFDCPADAQREVPLYIGPANRFGSVPAATLGRTGATITALGDGRVLIIGGENAGVPADPAVLIYDHGTGQFCSEGTHCLSNTIVSRTEHTATAVRDDDGTVRSVLIVGGRVPGQTTALSEVVRFDVGAHTFKTLDVTAATLARTRHSTVQVRGNESGQLRGHVLLIGGCGATCTGGDLREDLVAIDPDTGSVETIAYPGWLVPFYDATATILPSGTTVITGGRSGAGTAQSAVHLFNAGDESFTAVSEACVGGSSDLCSARYGHTATLLDDDNVLLYGGFSSSATGPALTAEVYLLGTNRVVPVSTTLAPRGGHTVTRVDCLETPCPLLVTGGRNPEQRNQAMAPGLLYPNPVADTASAYDAGYDSALGAVNSRAEHAAVALSDGTVFTFGGVFPQNDTVHSTGAVFSLCASRHSELTCPDL